MGLEQFTQSYLFNNGFILTDLPEKILGELEAVTKLEERKRGEVLFKQGGFPKGVYWLVSGKVKILQVTPSGQRQTLYIYSDGDIIGYRQLIAQEAHPVSAVLLENSIIRLIPGAMFRELIETSTLFSRNLLTSLSREFSIWMNRMTVFSQFDVRHRLILALLILHEQYKRSGSPPGVLTMTRTDLAEYVGSSLETVVRVINTLKTAGLVEIRGRHIFLPNPNALGEMLLKEGDKV